MNIFPEFVLTETVSSSCNVLMDVNVPLGGLAASTVDNLTFNISNIATGAQWLCASETDLKSLAGNNEWISYSVKVEASTIANFDSMQLAIGFANENFVSPVDNLVIGQLFTTGLSSGWITALQSPPDLNFSFMFNDKTLDLFTGLTLTASIKRDGSDFQITYTLANGEVYSMYTSVAPLALPVFNEILPLIIFSYDGTDLASTMEIKTSFAGEDLTHAKPSTATPCGGSLNTEAGASLPPPQTGQTVNFTPAGRTSEDDGGNQAGRLNKNSAFVDLVSVSADFGGGYFTLLESNPAQYAGDTNIIFGTQNVDVDNNVIAVNKLGLMYNVSALELALDLGWDDTTGSDDDIFEYCDQANLALLSGFSDWRVTNLQETLALLKYDGSVASEGPLIPWIKGEPDSQAGYIPLQTKIWTSTTNTDKDDEAYTIDDKDGQVKKRKKDQVNNQFSVILVRDIQRDAK